MRRRRAVVAIQAISLRTLRGAFFTAGFTACCTAFLGPFFGAFLSVAVAQAPTQRGATQSAKASAESAPRAQGSEPATTSAPIDSALEARTSRLAARLRCPVCQGLSIEDSPSELAVQMRTLVREQLASGQSEDAVRAFFVERYGEWILLAPRPTGFNLLVYVLPAFALIGGVWFVVSLVRRWTAAGPTSAADLHDARDSRS